MKKLLITGAIMAMSIGSAFAGFEEAEDLYNRNNRSPKYFPAIANELVSAGLYFSAIPFIKEYLVSGMRSQDASVDRIIEEISLNIGSTQFELMPKRALERSEAKSLKYALAKKYFTAGELKRALSELNGIPASGHHVSPFADMMRGSIYSLQGKHASAVASYRQCVKAAESELKETLRDSKIDQLKNVRDYCIIGIPRTEFAAGKYKMAHSSYMDLPKSSKVWPEILFEEAWTSFYLKDYNRTLGKLVTYNAPILKHLYNPEVDILKALTFMEMCLWSDASKVVDDFYAKNGKQIQFVKNEVRRLGNNYRAFYQLGKERVNGKVFGGDLYNAMLKTIVGDSKFGEMYLSFQDSADELDIVNRYPNTRFKKIVLAGLKSTLIDQRNVMGSYVRRGMHDQIAKMDRALVGMSYIKLEVLGRRKAEIYNIDYNGDRTRGDINNLKRNSKQYFWNFNGEFWADELGDYVFSLKSACTR